MCMMLDPVFVNGKRSTGWPLLSLINTKVGFVINVFIDVETRDSKKGWSWFIPTY